MEKIKQITVTLEMPRYIILEEEAAKKGIKTNTFCRILLSEAAEEFKKQRDVQ